MLEAMSVSAILGSKEIFALISMSVPKSVFAMQMLPAPTMREATSVLATWVSMVTALLVALVTAMIGDVHLIRNASRQQPTTVNVMKASF